MVPMTRPKRGRLLLNEESYIYLRPQYVDYVWSDGFVNH